MFKQNTYRLRTVICTLSVVLSVVALLALVPFKSTPVATAASSTYMNFQARLKNSSGGVVPDGNYNLEFKIYNVDSGGSAEWTETRIGGDKVRIANGYFSVSLGSVTAFSGIDWNEEHWITMNVGGTGSPSWDGEMDPRLQLTAVPYAFRAEQASKALSITDGVNDYTADDFIKVSPSTTQITSTADAAISLNQTGAGGLLQIQSGGVDMLTLDNTGNLAVSGDGSFDGDLSVDGDLRAYGDTILDGPLYVGTGTGSAHIILSPAPTGGSDIDFSGGSGTDFISFDNNDDSFSWTAGGWQRLSIGSDMVQILNSAFVAEGDSDLQGDVTVGGQLTVGTSDTTGTLLVLDTKTDSGDPAGNDGAMYYNSDAGKFRCYEDGSWVDCIGAGGISPLTLDGDSNLYAGNNTFLYNTSGTNNIALGDYVLSDNSTGSYSIAMGTHSLEYNSSGSENFAMGWGAMRYSEGGAYNIALGSVALYSNTGDNNLGLGHNALADNTSGDNSIGIGQDALRYNSSGSDNIAIGSNSMVDSEGGAYNVAVGSGSLYYSTGSHNIALGSYTGDNLTSGSYNILMGYSIDAASATGNYQLNIANLLTSSNYQTGNLQIGTSDTTGQLLVLDTKTDSGDPTGTNGAMYYNSNSNKFRCYQNSAWVDCIGTGSLSSSLIDNTADALDFQEGSNNYININTTNGSEKISFGNVTTNPQYDFLGSGRIQFSGSPIANNSATGTTGTTTGTGTDTTTLTLTTDAFAVNDVVLIDNAGQDYYTRITADPGTGTYTVSPNITFESGRTVTKYNIQNLGATPTDYTSTGNRFFQGYFLGGIVAGAGSTIYSDGYIKSSGTLKIESENIEITGELKVNNNSYVSFGSDGGESGYGLRDNGGTLEVKDENGCWYALNGGFCSIESVPVVESYTTYAPGSNGANSTLTIPAGTADGDLLIAEVTTQNSGNTVTAPGGWTPIASSIDTGGSGATRVSLYYRIASSDTPGTTRSFTHTSDYRSGSMVRISGADTTSPIHTYAYRTRDDDAQVGFPALTTSITNTLGLGFASAFSDAHGASAIPGWTTVSTYDSNYGRIEKRSLLTGTTYAAAETSVTETSTYVAYALAIKPGVGASFYGNAGVRLDNLTSVAINTHLLAGSNNSVDLGSSAINFRNLYLAGTASIAGQLTVGTSDTTGTLLVLDTKTDTGDPGSPVEGGMYYNSFYKSFRCYQNGAWRSCLGTLIASSTSVSTVASTATETDFGTTYTIPANSCIPGKVYRVTAQGTYGTQNASGQTLNIRVKLGNTVLGNTGDMALDQNVATGTGTIRTEFRVTCITNSSSGAVEGLGYTRVFDNSTTINNDIMMSNTSTIGSINFTNTQVLKISADWGASSSNNTITLRQIVMEELGQ